MSLASVDLHFKRAMVFVVLTIAQSKTRMASTVVALLEGNISSRIIKNGSVYQLQQELSAMASLIGDSQQIVISGTAEYSQDRPLAQTETSTLNDIPTTPNDNPEHLLSTSYVDGSYSMEGNGGGHLADWPAAVFQ